MAEIQFAVLLDEGSGRWINENGNRVPKQIWLKFMSDGSCQWEFPEPVNGTNRKGSASGAFPVSAPARLPAEVNTSKARKLEQKRGQDHRRTPPRGGARGRP